MNGPTRSRRVDHDALQARFALRVASRLSEQSEKLPHDLSERLRVAREQAVARARQLRLTQPATATRPSRYLRAASPWGNRRPGGCAWPRCFR